MSEAAGSSTKHDPCSPLLDEYLACVSRHTRGLREGQECQEPEARVYKECRAAQRALKLEAIKKSTREKES